MRIGCVIDSSSIISLCKCELESFLGISEWKFICPNEVFREVVEDGFAQGFIDAVAAKKLFDDRVIILTETRGEVPKNLSTDGKVIELASERKAMVLSNDPKLARKAVGRGIVALRSAGLCRFLAENGRITKSQFKNAVMLLVERNRLSEKNAEEYLKGVF